MSEQPELTDKQKADVTRARRHVAMVRGMQAAIVALSLYLAVCEKRGIAAVVIGIGIAACYQAAAMPVLPGWMDRHRPKDDD